ncbi:putative transcription factor MADS-type1 family [Helianthus annuus]|nr:putative transcription factor MADS-type1 family [Helianthus annuus]
MLLTNINTSVSMRKKTSKGRKKIEIKKIEETNSRQVTFSKRRTGLFKKASELCILTGAQVAILVNSPGGRVFAFGHPNIDLLLDRYLNKNNSSNNNNISTNPTTTIMTVNNSSPPALPTKEFNEHYVEVSRELEAEKKRREMIPTSSSSRLPWFEEGTEGLAVEELEQYLWSLVELKKKVLTRADELMMINKSPALLGGSSVYEMWGNGGQAVGVGVGVPTNGGVHGGFVFQHGGEMKF